MNAYTDRERERKREREMMCSSPHNLGTRWKRLSAQRPGRVGYHFAGYLYVFKERSVMIFT
jgi:hypothetical protein